MLFKKIILEIDGACRGNPGEAAVGVVIRQILQTTDERLETSDIGPKTSDIGSTEEFSAYLGLATNNVAEYKALLFGLNKAKEFAVRCLQLANSKQQIAILVKTDSELLAKQINGEYQVKSPKLKLLHRDTLRLLENFSDWKVISVSRTENRQADRLAQLELRQHIKHKKDKR
ncbi:MAG: ribonuclease HI family protein [Candidatus Edwardsbacteria bacterium]